MELQEFIFLLIAIATGASAVATVTSTNLVHAAIFLAVTLSGIGAEFLVLHADFVAMVQLVVYVGAIAVLFLFGLMLTRAPIGREALDSQNRSLGLVVSVSLFGVLMSLIWQAFKDVPTVEVTGPNVFDIGHAIFSTWVLPFEIISMMLLGALVGSVMLSRSEDGESGEVSEPEIIQLSEAPGDERERALLAASTEGDK
jgi:NADH-quinone oxidoreductase subunit J